MPQTIYYYYYLYNHPSKLRSIIATYLDLFEVHRFSDQFIIFWQLLPGW